MELSTLAGYSILVVEDEPFIARCLRILLESAGAVVYSPTSVDEALRFADQPKLSAALLDYTSGIKDQHAIPRRLTALGLPFVFYGGRKLSRSEAWPNVPVVSMLANRAEIIETLRRLLQPEAPRGSEIARVA